MIITKTKITDLLILEPKVFGDSRGYFLESWHQKRALDLGINFIPVQHNESSSDFGVIRGLHYQLNPYAQAKIVRVVLGEVLLRQERPCTNRTLGKHKVDEGLWLHSS